MYDAKIDIWNGEPASTETTRVGHAPYGPPSQTLLRLPWPTPMNAAYDHIANSASATNARSAFRGITSPRKPLRSYPCIF